MQCVFPRVLEVPAPIINIMTSSHCVEPSWLAITMVFMPAHIQLFVCKEYYVAELKPKLMTL